MSIAVKPTEPVKIINPPWSYPVWLAARLRGENVAIPESVLEEHRVKIEPWMTRIAIPAKIFGADPIPAAKYVPPPKAVVQLGKVPVTFKVLNIEDRPIFGFGIRVNEKNLVTDGRGEAQIEVFKGHSLDWSTGRESGWSIPSGANRKKRMTGMVPMSRIFPVNASTMVYLYPESGEFKVNGKIYAQPITYTSS